MASLASPKACEIKLGPLVCGSNAFECVRCAPFSVAATEPFLPRPYCSRHRVAETSGAAAGAVRGVVMSGWRPSSTPTQPDPRLGHPTGSCCRDDRLIRASDDLSDPLGSHLCPVERGGVSWIAGYFSRTMPSKFAFAQLHEKAHGGGGDFCGPDCSRADKVHTVLTITAPTSPPRHISQQPL